jgi:hypothetical protein
MYASWSRYDILRYLAVPVVDWYRFDRQSDVAPDQRSSLVPTTGTGGPATVGS